MLLPWNQILASPLTRLQLSNADIVGHGILAINEECVWRAKDQPMRSLNIHEIPLWEDDFIMVNFTLMSGFFESWLCPFPNAIHLSQVAGLCVSLTSVSSRSGRKSLTWITSIMPIKAASMTGQSREEWLVLDLDEDLVDRLFQDGVHFFKDL